MIVKNPDALLENIDCWALIALSGHINGPIARKYIYLAANSSTHRETILKTLLTLKEKYPITQRLCLEILRRLDFEQHANT